METIGRTLGAWRLRLWDLCGFRVSGVFGVQGFGFQV